MRIHSRLSCVPSKPCPLAVWCASGTNGNRNLSMICGRKWSISNGLLSRWVPTSGTSGCVAPHESRRRPHRRGTGRRAGRHRPPHPVIAHRRKEHLRRSAMLVQTPLPGTWADAALRRQNRSVSCNAILPVASSLCACRPTRQTKHTLLQVSISLVPNRAGATSQHYTTGGEPQRFRDCSSSGPGQLPAHTPSCQGFPSRPHSRRNVRSTPVSVD